MPERIVNHSKYGHGVVKQSRYKDFELLVQFRDGLTRWVRFDELEQAATTPQIATLATPLPALSFDKAFKSRRMIEAFRLGIVPYDCVEDFTFGRQEESKELMNWLNSNNENVLLLVGEYGTGKTHLLHYAYWRALQEGFAVAYVSMDPNEVPFYKPKRVYSHLISTFRYYSKEGKQNKRFRDFLGEAIARGVFKDHAYFRHLIDKDSDEVLWNWIEASESIIRPYYSSNNNYLKLPGMYDHSTAANIYCYLLSALGWAAKKVLGLKGFLLIFDEAEIVDSISSSPQRKRGLNFLKALILSAQNDKFLFENPHLAGTKRDLDYSLSSIGRRTPFIYREPSAIKLFFAFTQTDTINQINRLNLIRKINLQSLPDTALKKVLEHVYLFYKNAYGNLKNNMSIEELFQNVIKYGKYTRAFVKSAVEALDLIRLNQKIG
ncbi:MAG: DUF2791 family P-loop domain-containing protein [Candidatus Brocadia sp.]|jgi:Cdc6-like AAA superfamily ATPase